MSEFSEKQVEQSLYTTFEPKSQRRFLAELTDSTGIFIPKFVVYSIDRPSFQRIKNRKTLETKWLPIKIKLYDPIIPSTMQAVWSHIQRNELFNIRINILGPVGDSIEEWEIKNCKILEVHTGTLDWRLPSDKQELEHLNLTSYYHGSTPINIDLTVEYEYAQLNY